MININTILRKLSEDPQARFETEDFVAVNTYGGICSFETMDEKEMAEAQKTKGCDVQLWLTKQDGMFRIFKKGDAPAITDFTRSVEQAEQRVVAFKKLYELIDFVPDQSVEIELKTITVNGKLYKQVEE